jgi:diacylglycerol kinase family enzyme
VKGFLDRGLSHIGISGGDGTIHQVLTRIITVYGDTPIPPILLLGDGTMNNIAHSIGIRKKGRSNLKKFLHDVHHREVVLVERGTMRIDGRYCCLFGCGMTSNFLTELYKGDKGYMRSIDLVRNAINEVVTTSVFNREVKLLRPLNGQIFCDGELMPLRHMLVVLAGTVEEVGFGLRPLYLASERKGHFHLIATDLDPKDVLFRLGFISTGNGNLIKNPRYCDRLVREILIQSPDPFEYTMDGDIYLADRELKVSAGPDIRFVSV